MARAQLNALCGLNLPESAVYKPTSMVKVRLCAQILLLFAAALTFPHRSIAASFADEHQTPCKSSVENGPEPKDIVVRRNESFYKVLKRAGLRPRDRRRLTYQFRHLFNLRSVSKGDRITFQKQRGGKLSWLEYRPRPTLAYCAESQAGGKVEAWAVELPVRSRVDLIKGSDQVPMNPEAFRDQISLVFTLSELFSWDASQLQTMEGRKSLRVLVEKQFLAGEFLDYGRVLAARFQGETEDFGAFYFEPVEGGPGFYYREDGEPILTSKLTSPVPGALVTSSFGRRYHPILKRARRHTGIDYNADYGTEVRAAADGIVHRKARNYQMGRFVSIEHADGLLTRYAHLRRWAKGVRAGTYVKRGQVIGYVGSSGLATGPHLHFEVMSDGRHVDPEPLTSPPAPALTPEQRVRFAAHVMQLAGRLDGTDHIAVAEPAVSRRRPLHSGRGR